MKKIIMLTLIFALISFSGVLADNRSIEGEIGITGKLLDISGNEAKFNKYRDIRDGVHGRIRLLYDTENYFLRFKASDFGYDTQNYRVDGGSWGKFRFYLQYNEIPHNFTYGARTFYLGAGTNNLTTTIASGPVLTNFPVDIWNIFDYSLKRKQFGGGIRLDMAKPFYVNLSVSREQRDGTIPMGVALGGGGNPAMELPSPVDYRTDVFKVEVGYAQRPLFASLSYYYSEFSNAHDVLNFQAVNNAGALTAVTDKLTLPPDNEYHKIQFKGSVALPLNSRFSANLSSSSTKSSSSLLDYRVSGGASTAVIYPDGNTVFNGRINTESYVFTLTSSPVSFLDGKIFYRYHKRDNKSDEIRQTVAGVTLTNRTFEYEKNSFGAELGLKLPANFRLTPAYTHVKTKRERGDLPKTNDNIYSLDLRWTGLDFMTAKAGYERMVRRSEWQQLTRVTGVQLIADLMEPYVRRYDAASKNQDTYKIEFDFYPLDNLSFGAGYNYRRARYIDTVLGLRNDRREVYMLYVDYLLSRHVRLSGYWDYEKIKSYQFQRRLPPGVVPTPVQANPFGPEQTATHFNWDVTQKHNTYNFGIGSEIYAIPKKLTLKVNYDYVDSDGFADFTYFVDAALTGGRTNDNIDISNWPDYKRSAITVRVIYNVTRSLSLKAGYAYEHFRYKDATLDNYQHTLPANNFWTGAYRDQSYNANVVFAGVTYRF